MWALIDIAKKGRSIVLTTHSMEEADALCQRIGIMAYGTLRCLGPSLHLKRRFGDGFRIEVTHAENGAASARAFLAELLALSRRDAVDECADAKDSRSDGGMLTGLSSEDAHLGANTIVLLLPHGSVRLAELFARMEARPDEAEIVHWSLRQPSLEEVFLNLIAEAEQRHGRDGELITTKPEAAAASTQMLHPDAAVAPKAANAPRTALKRPVVC